MVARILLSAAVTAGAVLAVGSTVSATQIDEAAAAAALSRLDVTDLEGRRWSHESLRGRVVLLDFWASWCAPCLADFPKLQALRARYPRDEFEILGVSLDTTSRRSLTAFLNRNRIDWPQIHQPRGYASDIARLFRVDRLPGTVLLDRNGSVAAVNIRGDLLATRIHGLIRTEPPESSR